VRTLAIGMDAADSRLVLDLIRRGELPTLGALAERGGFARLETGPPFSQEVAWPTIITGCLPDKHGIYNWRAVVPATHRLARTPARTYRQPFWTQLRRADQRALLIDVPATSRREDDGLVELLGWGQRGAPRHHSWPPDLLERVNGRYGRFPSGLDDEHHGRRWRGMRLLRDLKRMTEVRTEVTADLMRDHEWNLCLVAYFETHYGGHAFHRYLDPDSWGHDQGRRWHSSSLVDLYRSFDRSVERLLDVAGPDANVLIFSGFGMRANTNDLAVLEQVMIGLGYQVPRSNSTSARWTESLRRLAINAVPAWFRRAVNRRLPEGTSDRHLERLWLESTDWDRTSAYALGEPGHSFVRLTHPERPDAEALRDEIAEELGRLTDVETGRPAVESVTHRDRVFSGPNARALPDLSIAWSRGPFMRRVRHPRLGEVEEDLRHIQPSEHTEEGFVIAAGPGIQSGAGERAGHVSDLAPSVLHMHGLPIPQDMDGGPLDLVAESLGAPRREDIDIADEDPWRDH
jgi:predicted AlkP superfamily phosphohydrolase/phosphomutase